MNTIPAITGEFSLDLHTLVLKPHRNIILPSTFGSKMLSLWLIIS